MSVHKSQYGWYVKYKNKTKRGFKTKFEAQQYEAALRLMNGVSDDEDLIYFSEVAKDFLKSYKMTVTLETYKKVERVINNIILPNIENKPINKITELDCRKFKEYVYYLNYSSTYKNVILNKYKILFNHAIKYFSLEYNPSYVIDTVKMTFDEKMKKKKNEMNIWNDDEFNMFISNVNNIVYKELFILLYYTGMRIGELLALQWKDYYDNKLHIYKSLAKLYDNGKYVLKETKNTSSIRNIVLGKNIETHLNYYKNLEQTKKGFNDEWFIFGRHKPLSRSTVTRIKDRAIKKANLRKIRIHDFRHSHASNLIANGVNIVAVSRRLGHTDVNMTLKIYTHLLQQSEQEVIDYIDNSSQYLLTHEKNSH